MWPSLVFSRHQRTFANPPVHLGLVYTVEVYGAAIQKAREGKETEVPHQLWRDTVQSARQRVEAARASSGMDAADPRLPFGANAGTSSTAAAAVDEAVPVVVAYYGYDPSNRRIGKILPDFFGAFYCWSEWDLIEAYDLGFVPTTTWFEGGVIDEHLGYAQRDPSTGSWKRYGYIQDPGRRIMGVVDSLGDSQETYEYGPYGGLTAYSPTGALRGPSPTIDGQIYGFAGRQIDSETGLLYFRHRYYQPAHGRFLTEDRLGAFADAEASGNPYAYAGSMPTAKFDPLGLYTVVIVYTNGQDAHGTPLISAGVGEISRDPEGGVVLSVGPNGCEFRKVWHPDSGKSGTLKPGACPA
jgi:RHS repeat-associated protein